MNELIVSDYDMLRPKGLLSHSASPSETAHRDAHASGRIRFSGILLELLTIEASWLPTS